MGKLIDAGKLWSDIISQIEYCEEILEIIERQPTVEPERIYDLIDRQELLDAFGLSERTRKFGGDHSGYDTRMLYEIQDVIEGMPSAEPERRWIPCSERLPEEEKDVLVTVHFLGLKQEHYTGWNDHINPKYYVEVASHIDGEWSSYSDDYKVARNRHKVIAWMPLPEPYKEVEHE